MYKTNELKFEVETGEDIEDMFGVSLTVAVGTDNNDDDICEDDIDNDEFSELFTTICENVFVLTTKGEERFNENTKEEVIKYCENIGMVLEK